MIWSTFKNVGYKFNVFFKKMLNVLYIVGPL